MFCGICSCFINFARSASSGESNYSALSTLSFSTSLTLDIEKNTVYSNKFNLMSDLASSLEKATSSLQISFSESDSEFSDSFKDANLLYWKVDQVVASVSVSILGGNCAFPLIFGSSSQPSFQMDGNIGRLDVIDSISDFTQRFGVSKTIASPSYSTTKAGSSYKYINVVCPFYTKVFQIIFGFFYATYLIGFERKKNIDQNHQTRV